MNEEVTAKTSGLTLNKYKSVDLSAIPTGQYHHPHQPHDPYMMSTNTADFGGPGNFN
jgi:hypothetical protein